MCVIRDTAPGGIADVQMELALRSAARSRRDNKRTWQLPSSTHLISGTERRKRWEQTLRAAREQADETGPDGPMSQTFSLHQAQLRTHLPHSLSRRVPARLNPFHYNLPSLAPSCQLHNSHKRRMWYARQKPDNPPRRNLPPERGVPRKMRQISHKSRRLNLGLTRHRRCEGVLSSSIDAKRDAIGAFIPSFANDQE